MHVLVKRENPPQSRRFADMKVGDVFLKNTPTGHHLFVRTNIHTGMSNAFNMQTLRAANVKDHESVEQIHPDATITISITEPDRIHRTQSRTDLETPWPN